MTLSHSVSDGSYPAKHGFLRLKQVLELVPLSRSAWYEGIRKGVYPSPIKLGARASAWRASDIQNLLDRLSKQGA